MDWQVRHDEYDRPNSRPARRLRVVQDQLRRALDDAPPGSVRFVGYDQLGRSS